MSILPTTFQIPFTPNPSQVPYHVPKNFFESTFLPIYLLGCLLSTLYLVIHEFFTVVFGQALVVPVLGSLGKSFPYLITRGCSFLVQKTTKIYSRRRGLILSTRSMKISHGQEENKNRLCSKTCGDNILK